jgi:hypothetical protein
MGEPVAPPSPPSLGATADSHPGSGESAASPPPADVLRANTADRQAGA